MMVKLHQLARLSSLEASEVTPLRLQLLALTLIKALWAASAPPLFTLLSCCLEATVSQQKRLVLRWIQA